MCLRKAPPWTPLFLSHKPNWLGWVTSPMRLMACGRGNAHGGSKCQAAKGLQPTGTLDDTTRKELGIR